jgi:hypothetical protein
MATRRPVLVITVATIALAVAIFGSGFLMMAYPGGWWGTMGPGMMGGYEPRILGPGWGAGQTSVNLSTDDVKTYFERSIAWQRNPLLKVGDVKERDADGIVVDIVTKDNSLVERFIVNRHNGLFRPSED